MKQILKLSQIFSQLDPDTLEEVTRAATKKRAQKGEVIFNEGAPAHAFFVVGSGRVKISKMSPDGKEQILFIAGPGDTFAEAAMFTGRKFPASAEALEDSELVAINRDRFLALLERKPGIALSLIAELSILLHKLNRLVGELSLTDVNTRLALYLLDRVGTEGAEKQSVTLMLTEKKSVLASLLGTIPETLSRAFSRLSSEGIIRVEGSRITILDLGRLRGIAGE